MEEYNWSDLEVGDRNLNHSEGYFALKHSKHEKNYKEELVENKENIEVKKENGPSHVQAKPLNKDIKKVPVIKSEPSDKKLTTIFQREPPINLLKTAMTRNAKRFPQQEPSAYRYKEIYDNKKKQMINKVMETEKKNRQFHSRPAPNFKKSNPPEKKAVVTFPITPKVLKKSREFGEIQRRKLEEFNAQNQPPKLSAREPKVLYEEPFVPKKIPHYVHPEPFNLNLEKRLEERKQYDISYNKKLEQKKKILEMEQKTRDENFVKEFRKLATFRATPINYN